MKLLFLSISVSVFLFFSCDELIEYSKTPSVANKGYMVEGLLDTTSNVVYHRVTFQFLLTDGDGDVGYTPEEKSIVDNAIDEEPIPKLPESIFIERYKKINGEYVVDVLATTLNKSIPLLEPKGQNKTLIADVEVSADIYLNKIADTDTIAFKYYVKDRSSNESNKLFTLDIPFRELTEGYVEE